MQVFTKKYIQEYKRAVHDNPDAFVKNEIDLSEAKYIDLQDIDECRGLAEKMVLPSANVNTAQADCESGIAVYEALKNLSPVDATLDNVWITLHATELHDYITQRWLGDFVDASEDEEVEVPLDETKTESRNKKIFKRILGEGQMMRFGVAGLWWKVYLTVTDNEDDPYELTRILFSNIDFVSLRFGEGSLIRLRPAMLGILKFLRDHEEMRDHLDGRGQFITQYFNKLGCYTHLDFYEEDFFYHELERLSPKIMEIKTPNDVQNHPELFTQV